MPLESATHIADLNTSNPVGSTDKVQTLDDHVRLIKSVLKTDLNLSGAVTASHNELNILDGATLTTAELNILDGVTLTAAQINEAARLSASNVFTGATQQITQTDALWRALSGTIDVRLRASTSDSQGYVGTSSAHKFGLITGGVFRLDIDSSGNFNFWSGTVTTAGSSASEVGYSGTPQNTQNGNYTLVLADRGKVIYKASGGAGETITIPANGSVAFPVGTIIRIVNNGGGALSIAITTDTLSLAGAGTTGTRTLSDHGVAVLEKVSSTEWFISGVGVS